MKNMNYIKKTVAGIVFLIAVFTAGCSQKDAKPNPLPSETPVSQTVRETPAESITEPVVDEEPATEEPAGGAHEVSVLFINVGRADAALIEIDDAAFLIDTGEKSSVPALYRVLALRGVNKLDAVFLTHTHSDHIGGMEALTSKFKVETLYSAMISENKKNGENRIDSLAADLSLKHVKLKAGDKVPLAADLYFEVLGPLEYNAEDDNDNSLVLKLKANGKTFLFTGDMEFSEEQTLLASGAELSADILKVGNHGNPDATSVPFAHAVSPKIAVISTDTAVDDDSANAIVKKALSGARIIITQDYTCGVLFTVDAKGAIEVSDPKPEKNGVSIKIENIDKQAQTVTLVNNGIDTDISGYFLISERGSEIFVFPEGAIFKAGQTLTVACSGGKGDFIWKDKKVWHPKKDDAGILYDAEGNEISRKQ